MTHEPTGGPPASRVPGVRFLRNTRHADARGSFLELWRASQFGDPVAGDGPIARGASDRAPRFVQANLSTSAGGVLRGLHVHLRQLDYWTVLSGHAFVALVDIRPLISGAAAPGGRPIVETHAMGPDDAVVLPAGVAHGFMAIQPLELLYLVTNEYDGSDELGFAWDDPAVGVAWPFVPGLPDGRPILSDRDRSNPSLAELVARLRA